MSADQEKNLEPVAQSSAEVVVEKPPSNKLNPSYLPNIQEPLVELSYKEKIDAEPFKTEELDTGAKSGDATATVASDSVEEKVEKELEEVTTETLDTVAKDGNTTIASDKVEEEVEKEQKEVMSSDKEKLRNILSKKKEPSSEEITVTALDMESKICLPQPIPALMTLETSRILESAAEKDNIKKSLEDKIEREEIAELQSVIAELQSDAPDPRRDWETNIIEANSSKVGICIKRPWLDAEPSGISISISQKHSQMKLSGINLAIPKKENVHKEQKMTEKHKFRIPLEKRSSQNQMTSDEHEAQVNRNENTQTNLLQTLKAKCINVIRKIHKMF